MIREDFFKMMHDEFGCEPDYPFAGDFQSAVFRRKDNLKWFAIVLTVEAKKTRNRRFRRTRYRQSEVYGRGSGFND